MEPHSDVEEAAYLVSGSLLDDESIGPLFATCAEAHTLARTAIAGVGGTVRILRNSADGWIEVARYTDTGRYSNGRITGLGSWAVIAAAEDEPVTLPSARRRPFARLRGGRR